MSSMNGLPAPITSAPYQPPMRKANAESWACCLCGSRSRYTYTPPRPSAKPCPTSPLSAQAFIDVLQREGQARYHHQHPFHVLMHNGGLSRDQLQLTVITLPVNEKGPPCV